MTSEARTRSEALRRTLCARLEAFTPYELQQADIAITDIERKRDDEPRIDTNLVEAYTQDGWWQQFALHHATPQGAS